MNRWLLFACGLIFVTLVLDTKTVEAASGPQAASAAEVNDSRKQNVFPVRPPTGNPAVDFAAIQSALAQAKAWQSIQPKDADGLPPEVEVVLGPGTYNLNPPANGGPGGNYGLHLVNWQNLQFKGTEFRKERDPDSDAAARTKIVLLTPDAGFIEISNSQHITLADLTFDYQVPPFTQGTIVAVNKNKDGITLDSLDVRLDEGFQTFGDPIYQAQSPNFLYFAVIMDPTVARVKRNVPNFMRITYTPPPYAPGSFAYATLLPDQKTWRVPVSRTGPDWRFSSSQRPLVVPGDRFVFVTRLPNNGTFVQFSDTITFSHLTYYAAGALTTGFVENTGPILVDDLDVRIRPGSNRLISSDADGAHFQNDRGQITIRNSRFQGMADDAIAIYSVSFSIPQVLSFGPNGQIVVHSPRRVLVGDQIQILDSQTGAIRGLASANQSAQFPCPAGSGVAFCYTLTMDKVPDGTLANDIAYLYNAAGNGAEIYNNIFEAHRGHGMLLNSPHSSVSNNQFIDINSGGVMVGPFLAAFQQGPVPDHVLIRDNLFIGGDVVGGQVVNGAWSGPIADPSHQILVTSVIPNAGVPARQITGSQGPSTIGLRANRFRNPVSPSVEVDAGSQVTLSNDHTTSEESVIRVPGPSVLFSRGIDLSVNHLSLREAGPNTTAAVEVGCQVDLSVNPSLWTIESAPILPVLDDRLSCHSGLTPPAALTSGGESIQSSAQSPTHES